MYQHVELCNVCYYSYVSGMGILVAFTLYIFLSISAELPWRVRGGGVRGTFVLHYFDL